MKKLDLDLINTIQSKSQGSWFLKAYGGKKSFASKFHLLYMTLSKKPNFYICFYKMGQWYLPYR